MSNDDAALGSTIRAWRDRLRPEAAGLPARRTRRAAGLRREELAELAGISVDYLTRLEQGRSASPSEQVVASLARALQLSVAERDHLYRLVRLAVPAHDAISDHIPPGVRRVLAGLEHTATAVFAADWQLLWWNRGWAALVGDPAPIPVGQRNFARDTFPVRPDAPLLRGWPVATSDAAATEVAVVSDLRRATGRYPADVRLRALVADLIEGNRRFAELWALGTVGAHREDSKTIHHRCVGPVDVTCDVLTDGDLELKIVVLSAAPGSEDETRLRLAFVAGNGQVRPEHDVAR
ncbi:helix-turn-helix domain-containing protein [Lentzea sp. NEAU-D7]|uniref:helix-turn-helix domain-containing protein n=1 Tax=Lentzea sp. NEAU-D7 TaxID=2994667 RepID=UPI00224A6648|nr:helix-turn-helix transcriptional regulator [Lentzea sp. NEAU-D7]MCX2951509.1 helix-turn-helix transcriptional regulator [Lentzea sp. NEAU-D7]